jgi:hypothetical protein
MCVYLLWLVLLFGIIANILAKHSLNAWAEHFENCLLNIIKLLAQYYLNII